MSSESLSQTQCVLERYVNRVYSVAAGAHGATAIFFPAPGVAGFWFPKVAMRAEVVIMAEFANAAREQGIGTQLKSPWG